MKVLKNLPRTDRQNVQRQEQKRVFLYDFLKKVFLLKKKIPC